MCLELRWKSATQLVSFSLFLYRWTSQRVELHAVKKNNPFPASTRTTRVADDELSKIINYRLIT